MFGVDHVFRPVDRVHQAMQVGGAHDENSARLEDPQPLGQASARVGQVLDDLSRVDGVEGAVLKGQVRRVPSHPAVFRRFRRHLVHGRFVKSQQVTSKGQSGRVRRMRL